MRSACLISSGSELMLGLSTDTNAPWLARELASVGVLCHKLTTVGDDHAQLVEAILDSAARGDVVILTGGLGPTADDLTRAALADAAGDALVEDAAALREIEQFFVRRGRSMPPVNRVQAQRPRGGRCLSNATGTAPGLSVRVRDTPCFALPGVPSEMREMFAAHVLPLLRAHASAGVIRTRLLHCIGRGESEIGEIIRDLMARGRNPEVGTTAQASIIGVRLRAAAATAAEANALLDRDEAEIRSRLGKLLFARDDESLAGAVGALLRERGLTLAVAESCTGGLIGRYITDVPGSSDYFLGGVICYANELKMRLLAVRRETLDAHGAVSGPVAVEMAQGARAATGGAVGLAVTGIAGPGGGTSTKPVGLVYVAVADAEGCDGRELLLGETSPREQIRERAARSALNLLRLRLRLLGV